MKNHKFNFILLTLSFILYPLSFLSADEIKYQPNGPLNIRNQMPMYMFYMSMMPQRAETVKKGKFEIEGGYHVSNNILRQHDLWGLSVDKRYLKDLTYWILIDAEVNRFYIDLTYGILDNLNINVNIPYIKYAGGYLDTFIENFEKSFSFIEIPSAREERPKDKYEIELIYYGQTIIHDFSKPGGLGEITVESKYKILNEDKYRPAVSLRGSVKLPTASNNTSGLLGSKKPDYGFGLMADKRLMNRLYTYANFNLIFIQKPDILEQLDVKNRIFSGLLGIEFFLTNRTSSLLQVIANTSVYEEGVHSMEKAGMVVSAGFNHNFNDKISWQIGVDENINSAAPDFGLFTSLKIKL